jgi:Uma2 family endonuclease
MMSTAILPAMDPELAQYYVNNPIQMLPAVSMTQDQFFDFCQQNRKLRFERTAKGELIVMPPAGGESSVQNLSVAAQLYNWCKRVGVGKAFDSSGGFILPSGANRSPDASWISPEQLAVITPEQMKRFVPVCPFFLVELLSPSDSLKKTQEKMVEYIANGCKLGWMIVPDKKQVHVYRPDQPVQVLDNPQTVSGDPELPGFVLDLDPVWRP